MPGDRTGIARGTLRPCVYFKRGSDGFIILAPMEIGGGLELARKVYELKYKNGWGWGEASTLSEVDKLQQQLAEQEIRKVEHRVGVDSFVRERIFRETGDALRSQMVSAATSQWEKDFIRCYLQMREEKRNKYRSELTNHNYYIYARENSESKSVEDLLPLQPGQFERTGV